MLKKIFKILLGLTITLLPLYVLRFKIGAIPTTFLEILIYLSFISFLSARSYREIKSALPIYLGGLFCISGLIGAILDPNFSQGLGIWKAYFFDGFLVFVMILSIKKNDVENYLNFIVASGLISTLIAFYLYSLGIKTSDGRLLDLDRLSPNYLAMFLTVPLVVAFAQMLKFYKKDQLFWVYLLAILNFAAAIYLTGSRGGMIASFAGILVVIFSRFIVGKKAILAKWLLAMSLILVLALTYFAFQPDWSSHARKATSSNIRFYIWSTSIEMIKKEPIFGVGLSNYQNYFGNLTKDRVNYPEFITPQALTAHNLYLQIYLTCGLLGLIVFVIFILQSKFWNLSSVVLSSSIISILIFALFDTPFFRNDLAVLFWIILSMQYCLLPTSSIKNE